jgi:hypothetical protein
MVTDHDPKSQVERQLWAAYRLILTWPKRETIQGEVRQSEGAGDDDQHTEKPQHNEAATVKNDSI